MQYNISYIYEYIINYILYGIPLYTYAAQIRYIICIQFIGYRNMHIYIYHILYIIIMYNIYMIYMTSRVLCRCIWWICLGELARRISQGKDECEHTVALWVQACCVASCIQAFRSLPKLVGVCFSAMAPTFSFVASLACAEVQAIRSEDDLTCRGQCQSFQPALLKNQSWL